MASSPIYDLFAISLFLIGLFSMSFVGFAFSPRRSPRQP